MLTWRITLRTGQELTVRMTAEDAFTFATEATRPCGCSPVVGIVTGSGRVVALGTDEILALRAED